MKNLIIFGLVFLVLISSSFAVLNDAVAYYSFDTGEYNSTHVYDLTGNQPNAGLLVNTPTTGATGILGQAVDFEFTNSEYINLGIGTDLDGTHFNSNGYTMSLWFKPESFQTYNVMFGRDGAGANERAYSQFIRVTTGNILSTQIAGTNQLIGTSATVSTGSWYHLVFRGNTTGNLDVWVNGVKDSTTASWLNMQSATSVETWLCGRIYTASNLYCDGVMDEVAIYDRPINDSEIAELYNNGTGYNPYAVSPFDGDAYIEQIVDFTTDSPVTINGATYQTVVSGDFTPEYNTSAYIATTLVLENNPQVKTMSCRATIDGVDYNTEKSRSLTSREVANVYLYSTNFTLTANQTYTYTLECNETGGGNAEVTLSESTINLLYTEAGNQINSQFFSQEFELNSSSYQLLLNTTFNTSENASTLNRSLFFGGKISYEYVSDAEISLYAVINESVSPIFIRGGSAGSTGSGAAVDFDVPVANNATVPILLYGKSSSSDGNVTINAGIFEFLTTRQELNQTNITGLTTSSTTWVNLTSFTVNDTNRNNGVFDVIASISNNGTGSGTVDFRLRMGEEFSQTFSRDISSTVGVSIINHVFKNPTAGLNTISLQAQVDTGSVTIQGGDLVAIVAQESAFSPNSFNVTLFDDYDGTPINTFNVSLNGGTVFQTTTGEVEIFTNEAVVNLTIIPENYFNTTVTNHNASLDLQETAIQAYATIYASELITNNSVTGSANFDGQNRTDTGVLFPIKAGTYNVTINASGYFNKTKEITIGALSNDTYNVTNMGNAQVNVSFYTLFGNNSAENVSGYIYNAEYGYNESFDTAPTNYYAFSIVQNITFDVYLTGANWAFINFTILTNQTESVQTEYIYDLNSINIQILDEVTGEVINGTTFQLDFVSTLNAFSVNTSNGTLYQTLITPEDYEIRYLSVSNNNYALRSYFFTLTNQSFNNITLYALNQNDTSITTADITFLILTTDLQPVENVKVTVQRYFLEFNGFQTVAERYTNTDGEAYGTFETIDAFYRYLVYYDDVLEYSSSNTGTQFVADSTITIYIDPTDNLQETVNNVLDLSHTLTFTELNNYSGYFELIYTNPNLYQVCLSVDNSSGLFSETCQASTSGTIQINVTHDNQSTSVFKANTLVLDNSLGLYLTVSSLSKTYFPNDIFSEEALKNTVTFIVALLFVALALLFINNPIAGLGVQTALFIVLWLMPVQFIQVSWLALGYIISLVLGVMFIAQKR